MVNQRDAIPADPDEDRLRPARIRPLIEAFLSFVLAVALSVDLWFDARRPRSKVHLAIEIGALCTALLTSASLWLRCWRGAARRRTREPPTPVAASYDDPIDSGLWKAIGAATRVEAGSPAMGVELMSTLQAAVESPGVRFFVIPEPPAHLCLPAPSPSPAVARPQQRHARAGRYANPRVLTRRGV
jgi:hypothetical protein